MKTSLRTIACLALLPALVAFFVGCESGNKGQSETPSMTEQIIDDVVETTFAAAESTGTADVEFASATLEAESNEPAEVPCPVFKDMLMKNDIVYTAVEQGIFTYNMVNGTSYLITTESPINALVDFGDKIYAGGDNLYAVDEYSLTDHDYQLDLPGEITTLQIRSLHLMIGTTDGLFILGADGIRELASHVHVSALASDFEGVWVGTAGDGLYRWNGDSFRKRYLKRDSTLFDNVTALDFSHNHLYMGTDKGMFIFNGGSWQPYGVEDGLPSKAITAINADEWVIKIGTAAGPVTFFNNEFKPMKNLERMVITDFIKADNKLVAATIGSGLVMKSGGLVTTLFNEDISSAQIALEEQW